jgi:hypothetical protein
MRLHSSRGAGRRCANCGYGWRRDDGNIGCGAPVDDDEIRKPGGGKNPVWAIRKYGPATIAGMLAGRIETIPRGSDAENMRPDDGEGCPTWRL